MDKAPRIQKIAIDSIVVANPRSRDREVFAEIKNNVSQIGLKRPITVAPMRSSHGKAKYRLVCGQGRLECLRELGETKISAVVKRISAEEAYLMSLVENIARRKPDALQAVEDVKRLKEQGYTLKQISLKTDLTERYLRDILKLFDLGEERLLAAVHTRRIPVYVAVQIAQLDGKELQAYMMRLFEDKKIDEAGLKSIRRIVEGRSEFGKVRCGTSRRKSGSVTPQSVMKTFERETRKQSDLIEQHSIVVRQNAVLFSALSDAISMRDFRKLLTTEGLNKIPALIASDLKPRKQRNDG